MPRTEVRGGQILDTSISLTADVTGTLPVANGGTGNATNTLNNVLLGNGTGALQVVAPGASGNVLTSNGTTWTSAAPGAGSSLIYDSYVQLADLTIPTNNSAVVPSEYLIGGTVALILAGTAIFAVS